MKSDIQKKANQRKDHFGVEINGQPEFKISPKKKDNVLKSARLNSANRQQE